MIDRLQFLFIAFAILFSVAMPASNCVNYFGGGDVFYLIDINDRLGYTANHHESRESECAKEFQNIESSEINEIISYTYLQLAFELADQKKFESILPLLNKIKTSALNGNKEAEVFFLTMTDFQYESESFKKGNIVWDYFFDAQQLIFAKVSQSRKLLADFDDLRIDSLEVYQKQRNILQSINFYKLPTIIEKLEFLDFSIGLLAFDNSDLKTITNYFLNHFDNNNSTYINRIELRVYTNLLFHLINSDHSNYVALIEEKLKNRLAISKDTQIEIALLNLSYLSPYVWNDFLIFTLILNLQSYEFNEYPYAFDLVMEKRAILFERLKDRLDSFNSVTEGSKNFTKEWEARLIKFSGIDSWISDTAIKYHDYPIVGNCKKALSQWDAYINIIEDYKKHIPDYDDDSDLFEEMILAANCAIKESDASLEGVKKARKYYLLSSQNLDPRADKFQQLFYKIMNTKILYYDSSIENHMEMVFNQLIEINNELFSEEFYLKSFRQTEFFDRSITIYSMLYSYFTDLKWENLSDLTHPLEWTDLKQALINNNSLSQLNSSSNSKLTTNLQESLQSINLEISILEKSFIDSSESNTFMKLQEKFIEKQNIVNRIFAVNQNLKDFVTYDNTHFDEFRSNLEENSYILAVHFGPQDSYGYLVSRDSSKIVYIPANKHEASWSFARFNEEIQANDIAELSKSSTILYRRFFKDLLDDVPEGATIFLYGDEFNHIPMNALSIRYKEKDSDYERMLSTEWLIKKYKFSHIEPYYSYSDAKRKYQEEFLGIANPQLMKPLNLPSLPSAEQEILRLGLTVGATKDNFLVKENASFENLVNKSNKSYKNIVFATHAITRDDVNNSPGLVISKDEDNFLSVLDILDLGLSADLVVLSACYPVNRTGALFATGDNPTLPRAFLISGTNSVVSSNWEVETLSAAKITQYFYESMWQNPDQKKYEALRNANLEVLYDYSDPTNIYPKNWANLKITYKNHYSL